jgi:uncharacterized protein
LTVTIGTASAETGSKAHGFLEVSRGAAGLPIGIPVVIVNGSKPGPTIVANAAMHGTENLGTAAISRFYRRADPEKLRGTFLGVPILSMWAFEAEHRLPTLFDHFDIEKLFPGDTGGSITNRLAAAFMEEIASRGDCFIDFHGHEQYWQPTSAIIVPVPQPAGDVGREVYEKCIDAAKAFGVDQIWRVKKPGNYPEVIMRKRSVPAISTEFGGIMDFTKTEDYIEAALGGMMNVMGWMGMIARRIPKRTAKSCVCDVKVVLNRYGGMWSTKARTGDRVKRGDLLGTVSDPITAEVLEEVRSPEGGVLGLVWAPPMIKPAVAAASVGKIVEYV